MSKQQFFVNRMNKTNQEPVVTEEEMMERERSEKAGQRNTAIFVGIFILAGIGFVWFYKSFS